MDFTVQPNGNQVRPQAKVNYNFTNQITLLGTFPLLLLTKVKNRDSLATQFNKLRDDFLLKFIIFSFIYCVKNKKCCL